MIVSPTKVVPIGENLLRQSKKSHHHVATLFRGQDKKEDIVGSNRKLTLLQKCKLRTPIEVATQKEDIVGSNRKLMLRQKCKLRTPIEVATRNSCRDIKMS